jgi:hypothetical protein
MRKRPIAHGIIVVVLSLLGAAEAWGECADDPNNPFDTTVWMSPAAAGWLGGQCGSGCAITNSGAWFRYFPHQFFSFEDACEWPSSLQPGQPAYIFDGAIGTVSPGDSPATSGDLYIGGYSHLYDEANGGSAAETGDTGELRISGSSLTIAGCAAFSGGTDCYERVGYGGGHGKVVQSGGVHTVLNAITFGRSSFCLLEGAATYCRPCAEDNPSDIANLPTDPDEDLADICSEGEYELSDGELVVTSLDIGSQGKGTFTMTGGSYVSNTDPLTNAGMSIVGRTYVYSSSGTNAPQAGDGTFEQSGGTFEQDIEFSVGAGPGAVGDVLFSGSAQFLTQDLVGGHNGTAGVTSQGGTATITQTGGTVEVNRHLMLGESPDGFARYEISGGTLLQNTGGSFGLHGDPTQVANGVHVGVDHGVVNGVELDDGRGELTVVGKNGTIDIGGVYVQGSDSLLTFKLETAYPNVSPVTVAGVASFAPGAKIKIEHLSGYEPGYTTVTLLTAQEIIGFSNIVLEAPPQWSLTTTGNPPNMLFALHELPICGLLGIEPALVLGLLHATRRVRRRFQ